MVKKNRPIYPWRCACPSACSSIVGDILPPVFWPKHHLRNGNLKSWFGNATLPIPEET